MEKVSRHRAQNNVDAFLAGLFHYARVKRRVARVEDIVRRNAIYLVQMCPFLAARDSRENFTSEMLAVLHSCETDTSRGVMD